MFCLDLLQNSTTILKLCTCIFSAGGAKSFCLNQTMAQDFQQGLMAAATTTNAWIITGGQNCGVMALVGEAVSMSSFNSSVTAIGVANWGKTENKHMLDTKYAGEDLLVNYKTGNNEKRVCSLNPHHTHFFLVDDGKPLTGGCEIKYTIELQDIIQDLFGHEGKGLPKVCIMLEGGESSIDCAVNTVRNNNPLLIIRGTGRAAGIVCFALDNAKSYEKVTGSKISTVWELSESASKTVKIMIEKHFHKYGQEVCKRIFQKILQIVECQHMCRIYDTEEETGLDHAILRALIDSITEDGAAFRQMRLAISWNQPSVAEKYIFGKYSFKPDSLNHFLKVAIECQSTSFVRLLLHQGADLKQYLTVGELTHLYNDIPEDNVVAKLLNLDEHRVSLKEVGVLIEDILEGTYRSQLRDLDGKKDTDNFSNPSDLMMTYATLRGNFEMALLFWEYTKAPAIGALISHKICHYLATNLKQMSKADEEAQRLNKEAAEMFEDYAIGILDECSSEHAPLKMFLVLPRRDHNNSSIVEMAQNLEAKRFVAHSAYQSYLTDLWMGEIEHSTSSLWLLLSCFPGLCIFMDIFRRRKLTHEEREAKRIKKKEKNLVKRVGSKMNVLPSLKKRKSEMMRSLTYKEKFVSFFTAPVVKFIVNGLSTFIFLLIFTYVVLISDHHFSFDSSVRKCGNERYNDSEEYLVAYQNCMEEEDEEYNVAAHYVRGTPVTHSPAGWLDLLLLVWIISTMPVEVDETLKENPIRLSAKIKKHYKTGYNIIDAIAIFLFMIGFICRVSTNEWHTDPFDLSSPFNIARFCYILSLGSYLFRFLHLFEINSRLGPKINMIKKMMKDLVMFILILLVFLWMYIVVSEGFLNPVQSDPRDWRSISLSTFQRSFFNVFGEINIEDLNEDFLNYNCKQLYWSHKTKWDVDENVDKTYYGTLENYVGNMSGFRTEDECRETSLSQIFYRQSESERVLYMELSYVIIYVALCFYLLISNVLLINLLIAIFSSTYEKVEEESDVIYKFQRCAVIMEYFERPVAPNPFNVIEYLFILIKRIEEFINVRIGNQKLRKTESDPEMEYKVSLIEAECRARFKKKADSTVGPETRLINEIRQETRNIREELRTAQDLLKQIADESEIANKQKITPVTELWKKIFSHKFSRQSPYHGTDVTRFPVPDIKLKWQTKFDDYSPTFYDNPRDNLFNEPADPYLVSYFNENVEGVNRQSNTAEYAVIDGKPLNPKGRTGLEGRGELERWGPNHITISLISRWAMRDGKLMTINNQRIVEVIAIRQSDSEKWDLPGGYIQVNESISDAHKRTFLETTMGLKQKMGQKKLALQQQADRWMQSGIILYKGYFDDARNTDNSWIEVHAVNYHQEESTLPEVFQPGEGIAEIEWKVMDDKHLLNKNNLWMMKKMCIHLGAYNPYKGEILI